MLSEVFYHKGAEHPSRHVSVHITHYRLHQVVIIVFGGKIAVPTVYDLTNKIYTPFNQLFQAFYPQQHNYMCMLASIRDTFPLKLAVRLLTGLERAEWCVKQTQSLQVSISWLSLIEFIGNPIM